MGKREASVCHSLLDQLKEERLTNLLSIRHTCIPEAYSNGFTVDDTVLYVVVEHGRYVVAWKRIGRPCYQEARFPHCPVTDHHHLKCLHRL